jgi:hypothetical protein
MPSAGGSLELLTRGFGVRLRFRTLEKVDAKFLENHRSREQPEVDIVDFCAHTPLVLGRPRDYPLQRERECKAKCDEHSEDHESDLPPTADALEEIGRFGARRLQ